MYKKKLLSFIFLFFINVQGATFFTPKKVVCGIFSLMILKKCISLYYKKQSILVQKKIKRINVLNENAFEVVFDENNVPFRISREPDLSSQGKITVIDAPLPVVYKNNFLKNPSENLFFSKIFKGINFLRKSFLKHVLRIDITSNSFDDITKREFIYDGYEFKYDEELDFLRGKISVPDMVRRIHHKISNYVMDLFNIFFIPINHRLVWQYRVNGKVEDSLGVYSRGDNFQKIVQEFIEHVGQSLHFETRELLKNESKVFIAQYRGDKNVMHNIAKNMMILKLKPSLHNVFGVIEIFLQIAEKSFFKPFFSHLTKKVKGLIVSRDSEIFLKRRLLYPLYFYKKNLAPSAPCSHYFNIQANSVRSKNLIDNFLDGQMLGLRCGFYCDRDCRNRIEYQINHNRSGSLTVYQKTDESDFKKCTILKLQEVLYGMLCSSYSPLIEEGKRIRYWISPFGCKKKPFFKKNQLLSVMQSINMFVNKTEENQNIEPAFYISDAKFFDLLKNHLESRVGKYI